MSLKPTTRLLVDCAQGHLDSINMDLRRKRLFTDWYSFADYMKPLNERGISIVVFGWEYVYEDDARG